MQEAGRMGAAMKSKRLATSLDPDLVVEAGGEAWEAKSCRKEEKAGLVGMRCEHKTTDKSLDQRMVRGSAGRPPNRLAQGRTCLANS